MLPGIKNDLMYLLNILECSEKIILYAADCTDAEAFYENNVSFERITNTGSGTK
ncbi:hypothetical protein UF75_2092 [Desulfosporosinus sp. I2]|uniref:hypothetical protein n=1 Tax=Desulfosporosinus sp. I2 TaxID=1617025 RepID=UPI00061F5A59|nr:hypothetical protein [Desulfosporosinus sp. I2]KJR47514.1 hypothetical protein UF75_2092 [Desulfosporosinus sp. I2]